jgi:hypothetical protein
VRPLIFL